MAEQRKFEMTREHFEELEKKLAYLKGEKSLKIVEDIKTARGFGDLSENAEYDAARDAQRENEQEISIIEEQIRNAVIIDESAISTDVVGIGSIARFIDLDENEEYEFQILGDAEADYDNGSISSESPIGSGLISHKVGDMVTIEIPAGKINIKVLEIKKKTSDKKAE